MNGVYFFVCSAFWLMTFTDPKSQWPVNGGFFGLDAEADAHVGLFVFCTFLFVPLMVVAFCYFVKSIVMSAKSKSLRVGIPSLMASMFGVAALYRFNQWVFREVF